MRYNVLNKIKDHWEKLDYIYSEDLILNCFHPIYLIENHFLNWKEEKLNWIEINMIIPSFENVSFWFEDPLLISCSLKLFLIKATLDDSIIFDQKCSINWIAIERFLKYGQNCGKYSLKQNNKDLFLLLNDFSSYL